MPGSCDPGNVSFLRPGREWFRVPWLAAAKARVFRTPGLPPLLASLGPQQRAASLSGGIPEKERILGEVVVSVFPLATIPGLLDSNIDKVTLVLALHLWAQCCTLAVAPFLSPVAAAGRPAVGTSR